jgi:hypothetical protein
MIPYLEVTCSQTKKIFYHITDGALFNYLRCQKKAEALEPGSLRFKFQSGSCVNT